MKRLLLSMFIILLLCPLAYAWNFNTIGSSNDLGDTDSRADGEVIAWDATNEYYEHVAQSSSSAEGLWIAGDVNHIGPLTASINVTIDGNLSTTGIADIGGDIFTVGTKGAAVNAAVPTGNVDFSVKANAAHATGDIDVWGGEGGNASLALYSDERDDTTDDQVLIVKADNGNFTIANKVTGFTMATSGATTLTAVTADTLDTGQGANELYDMDQNVLQASDPTFNSLAISSRLTVTDNFQVDGGVLSVTADGDIVGVVGSVAHTGSSDISANLSVDSINVRAISGAGSGTATIGNLDVQTNLTVSGNANIEVKTLSVSGAYSITGSQAYGTIVYMDAANTITLPAIAEGMSVTVITIGAVAVDVDVNGSDYMILDGTVMGDGDEATNTSTAGDMLVATYFSADGWVCQSNGWTDD